MSGSDTHKKAVQRKAAGLILLLALVALAAVAGDGWRLANAASTEPATLESFLSRHGFSAIDDRADVKIGDETLPDASPLDVAARQGNDRIAALLIAEGVYVNAGGKYGETPLHRAAQQGQEEETFGRPALYAQASTDLAMSDLLKNMRSSQIFSVCGLPDVELKKAAKKAEDGGDLWQVELHGLDVFDPASMETDSRRGDDVPCWMLDTNYDGQCFRAGQVFFPRTAAWDKIRRVVKADFDDAVWEHLRGSVSAPFVAGDQVAVKVIDDRGNELMVVKRTKREVK